MHNGLSKQLSSGFKIHRNKHEVRIKQVQSRLISVFKILIKSNVLDAYKLSADSYDARFQVCRIKYQCQLPYHSSRVIEFCFEIDLQQKTMIVVEKNHSATHVKFSISPFFDAGTMQRLLFKRSLQWIKGAKAEFLFLKEFLQPLLELPCKRVLQAYHASGRNDKFSGIDFVISFLTHPLYETETVQFNLKSSHKYLEKHKKLYPKVSTFVFIPSDLRDMRALRRKFLQFISEARHTVCHH